jgi:hypothetical protein
VKFARTVYGSAAAYGTLSLLPLYFLVERVGRDAPPPVTHPEFYYGFLGVTFLWQLVFVLIATNPLRYRSLMPIAILKKFVYTVPVVILFMQGKVHASTLRPSLVDPVFGILFVVTSAERLVEHAPGDVRSDIGFHRSRFDWSAQTLSCQYGWRWLGSGTPIHSGVTGHCGFQCCKIAQSAMAFPCIVSPATGCHRWPQSLRATD